MALTFRWFHQLPIGTVFALSNHRNRFEYTKHDEQNGQHGNALYPFNLWQQVVVVKFPDAPALFPEVR